jgi:hypothetical protein
MVSWTKRRAGDHSTARRRRFLLPGGRPRFPGDVFFDTSGGLVVGALAMCSIRTGEEVRRVTLIRDTLRKHRPGTAWPYSEGKKAIEAMRLLARFRHDHFIAAHHDPLVWLQQMVTNQHPLELAPAETGIEKTLDRSVTATLVGPAGKALHRHASCHRPHRFRHPMELAERGRSQILAYTSENDDHIQHGRLLLVSRVGLDHPYSTLCSAVLPHPHFGEGIVYETKFIF